jgi:flagellar hook-associated protein 1 FlgK
MSSFSGLYIGLSALQAQQVAQETISHNVANVNTPGYTRRKVNLRAIPPADPHATPPQPGMGVDVAGIRRSMSELLNQQVRRETNSQSFWHGIEDGMSRVTELFQEPGDKGLGTLSDAFWNSWRELSIDASNDAARTSVRQSAETLASNIRRIYQEASAYGSQLGQQLSTQAQQINVLAQQVADINDRIGQATGAGDPANDLRDKRDMLLEDLSKLGAIRSDEQPDGRTLVVLGGHLLVGAHGATPLIAENTAVGESQLVWSDTGTMADVHGGAAGATLELQDWIRDDVLAPLDALAGEVIRSVNELHRPGYTTDNRTGIEFFAGDGAANIALSPEVAGNLGAIAVAAAPDSPADGSIALAIAALQDQPHAALGDSGIGEFYAGFVAQLGLDVQHATHMEENQDALVRFLNAQREGVSGVSLDEEAVQMISAQRAYQAAARIITAVDQMLEHLINNTGLVGR